LWKAVEKRVLSPLPGLVRFRRTRIPRLAAWAAFLRRFAANRRAARLHTSRLSVVLLISIPNSNFPPCRKKRDKGGATGAVAPSKIPPFDKAGAGFLAKPSRAGPPHFDFVPHRPNFPSVLAPDGVGSALRHPRGSDQNHSLRITGVLACNASACSIAADSQANEVL
jgi:hypothetical protein